MKVLKSFGQFVNENFGHEMEEGKMSSCCGAPIDEMGHCSECGMEEGMEHEEEGMDHEGHEHEEHEHEEGMHFGGHHHEEEEEEEEGMQYHHQVMEAKRKKAKDEEAEESDEEDEMPMKKKKPAAKKPARKEVMKAANAKFPNLEPKSMKKGLSKMKGDTFKAKAKKNFGWADKPEAAAAAYIRKATGKEPRDI